MSVFSRGAFRCSEVGQDTGTLGYRIQLVEVRRTRLRSIIEEINSDCFCAVMWHTLESRRGGWDEWSRGEGEWLWMTEGRRVLFVSVRALR